MTFICHVCGKDLGPYELHSCAGAAPTSNLKVVSGFPANAAQPSMYPDAAERRAYALLQAAATLYKGPDGNGNLRDRVEAVVEAEALLKIIEQRQKEGK